jgi:hypothetical protein
MADDEIFRCGCGYGLRARIEQRQVAEARRHACETHGISVSTGDALAVLLSLELEIDEEAPADPAMVEDTTRAKEET